MSDMEFTEKYARWVMSEFMEAMNALPAAERRRKVLAAILLMTAEELVPGVLREYAGLRNGESAAAPGKEESYEYIDDELSVRTVNALTRNGAEYHTKEQILNWEGIQRTKNFGRSSFVNLVDCLLKSTSPETIRGSVLWQSAPELWRERAEEKTAMRGGLA